MESRIEDKHVQGVVIEAEGGWFLRLQSPSILEEAPEEDKRNYIWYTMRTYGWEAIYDKERIGELETSYIKALGAPLQ